MDVGPHSFFSDDRGIVDEVLNLFENRLQPRPRRVKFHYRGRFIDYPLTARSALFQMGLGSGIRAAASFLASSVAPRRPAAAAGREETVEEWAIASYGGHLYRTFFQPYTEQFWKVPCTELSSRSIPTHTRMSFANTLRVLMHRRNSPTGESLVEREARPTYYPESGFSEIAEKIAARVRASGGSIRLGREVIGVERLAGAGVRVVHRGDGGPEQASEGDHVVSTIPLPGLVGMLAPAAPATVLASAEHLGYRSLVVLGMCTARQNILGCGYTYVLNRPYNRMFEMNSFSPRTSPSGENVFGVEIPCFEGSAAWKASREELFDMCIGSLAEDGFIFPGDVTGLLLVRAAHAYPVYRRDYAEHLERLLAHVRSFGPLSTLGRCGEFKYMDIDRCMRGAFELVDRLLGGSRG
jgi:protoporphyrinogen oxidase